MSPEDGGCFYHPDSQGTLRLSVLTFDTSAATGPPNVRHRLNADERAIDGGQLPNGCEFDVYETDTVEDGDPTRIRFWQIAQVLPGQCRIYLFSYAYPIAAQAMVSADRDMVDREIRQMIPYPEVIR